MPEQSPGYYPSVQEFNVGLSAPKCLMQCHVLEHKDQCVAVSVGSVLTLARPEHDGGALRVSQGHCAIVFGTMKAFREAALPGSALHKRLIRYPSIKGTFQASWQ
jgi:hypothetical protein